MIFEEDLVVDERVNLKPNRFKQFIKKIKSHDKHKYRILAEFNDSTYATIRFGE